MRKAKIICTLGPSSESQEAIESLILAGMNIARLNFSHGDYDFHRGLVNRVRAAAGKLGRPVAIMQDLQGPKIRCLKMENGEVQLVPGAKTIITTDDILGTAERFGTSYKLLPRDVRPDD
jgi:pyruvate kinase